MSASESSPDDKQTPEETQQPTPPKKPKRSLGFIESTDFQPSWLETGPLSPEMLAALQQQTQKALKTSDDQPAKISGGYTQRLAALEQFYAEQEGGTVVEEVSGEADVSDEESGEVDADDTSPEDPAPDEAADDASPTQEVVAESLSTTPDIPQRGEDEATSVIVEEPELEAAMAAPTEPVVEQAFTAPEPVRPDLPEALAPVVESILTEPISESDSVDGASANPRKHPLFDSMARRLLILGLLFSGLAALTLFINPFQRLALGTATLARPITAPDVAAPSEASGAWCLAGEVLGGNGQPLPLSDTGQNGDVVSGDNIFAVEFSPEQTGSLGWSIIDCQNPALAYPPAGAWVQVTEAGQPATFFFDSNRRSDPLFIAIPYVVTAFDGASEFRIVGTFQELNPGDPGTLLERVTPGVYQQVRQIEQPGRYEAYAISGDADQAIDAYGRTREPIPFAFETTQPDEHVVFLVDMNRGRASVLYNIPRLMTEMAYGNGYMLVTILLGVIGLLLLGWMLARLIFMANESRWLEGGCPQCGNHELIRVSRHTQDRLLHLFGLPAYRYQCRVCTWQGAKLSESGSPVSPGATIAVNELPRQRFR